MRARSAAIQGGLAAVGLLAVYGTWQREPERSPGEVVVADLSKGELQKIRYSDGKKVTQLEKRAGQEGVWLRIGPREDQKQPERLVRASESGQKLFDRFAPLRAVRALGVPAVEKMKEMGLDAPKRSFEVTGRQTLKFSIGGSPFGSSDPYVKDERDGRVYLLGPSVVSELDGAGQRFIDRTLHAFAPDEIEGVELTAPSAPGKKKEWVRGPGTSTMQSIRLASKKDAQKVDDLGSNWHDKVWRNLYPIDVLGEGESPASGAPTVIVRLDYKTKGKDKGFLELARAPAPAAPASTTPQAAPPPAEIFARTEHTAGWVKLPATSDDVLKEGEKIASSSE